MTPAAFIEKWSRSELRERQASHEHFIDLCRLLGEPTPAEDDPTGQSYCFERGASKAGGGDGWADVWRRGCFGWEYKGKDKDLGAALRQLTIYAADLEQPPYLVVSDMERIVVHTNWTNTVRRTLTFGFDELRQPARLDQLRQVFRGSEALKPGLSPQELTATVATRFGELGKRLQERKHDPQAVAHFLNRLIFCMFAEDAELLPKGLFTRTVKAIGRKPKHAAAQLDDLFASMRTGGFFGADDVRWFNGGLFDEAPALPLERDDLEMIAKTAAEHDWSNIDPAVFGTMFEAALKRTGRRAALGAHYTDREKILKIVDPVITRPLAAEWDLARAAIQAEADEIQAAESDRKAVQEEAAEALKDGAAAVRAGEAGRRKRLTESAKRRDAALGRAKAVRDAYLDRLAAFRVLDPACGSGNFLYVALHALRDLELRALVDADRLGLPQERPRVGLAAVKGIEIEPYAAELARVTLWIGDLQWERRNGFTNYQEPILDALAGIECRDALLDPNGSEAEWPGADVIIGNPPFLGGKRLRDGLGDETVKRLFATYKGRVPAEADLVCYWVEKAWRSVATAPRPPSPSWGGPSRSEAEDRGGGRSGETPAVGAGGGPPTPDPSPRGGGGSVAASPGPRAVRAGLVTTNSIRGGANRRVLEPIAAAGALHEAWSDEPWMQEGAAVRVSMLGFGEGFVDRCVDGAPAERINADLTSAGVDLTKAARLKENRGVAFQGITKGANFEVSASIAREWLKQPLNPNRRPNSSVLKPIASGGDIVRRKEFDWVIDLTGLDERNSSFFEHPFRHVVLNVQPERSRNRRELYRRNWWLFSETRPGFRSACRSLSRFIATPKVARQRVFVWFEASTLPDNLVIAIARDDYCTFGILSSKAHEGWSLRVGAWIGVGNDPTYTPSTTFETFPFPEGITPNISASDYADNPRAQAIATAAAELNGLRENWLYPPDLVRVEPEVYPTAAMLAAGHPKLYPDRILPVDAAAAAELKKRTLTHLYNQRPAWLDMAHRRLDEAVAAAYGWPADLPDDELLARLFALNQERAAAGR